MIRSILFILLTLISSNSFSKGGGVSGGGIGYLNWRGEVKLADLHQEQSIYFDFTDGLFNKNEILKNIIYRDNSSIKEVFKHFPSFFSCVIESFVRSNLKILEDLYIELNKVNPYLTEYRFKVNYSVEDYDLEQDKFPFVIRSSYLAKNTVGLAYYNNGTLVIQKRFYERLSKEDKCALAFHEAFRVLSSLHKALSTDEIQSLTRYFMKKKLSKKEERKIEFLYKRVLSNDIALKNLHVKEVRVESWEKFAAVLNGTFSKRVGHDVFITRMTSLSSDKPKYRAEQIFVKKINNKLDSGYRFLPLEQKFVRE